MTGSIHRMPFGAEYLDGKARFRLWAPAARRVDLCLEGEGGPQKLAMLGPADGWYGLDLGDVSPGARYRYQIDSGTLVPDPVSRFQPDDVNGSSLLVDPQSFVWSDQGWRGRPWEEAVIYELHIGTFTPQGTYDAVVDKLDHLIELGVTAIELMPLSEVPGRRSWGYDGVLPFAPESAYGHPDRLKRLVDTAHRRGLMVLLDVVYNHFGPEGNYLWSYAPQFFTERHHTPWGAAINFDGGSRQVRDFFIHNALYWLEEYHMDGLRFDAVHAIFDDSKPDILTELADTVRAKIGADRHVHLVLENDSNIARHFARDDHGKARWYEAQWDDDLHHGLHVMLTGESGGYYEDYRDLPIGHLGRALAEGFAYQGETSPHRGGEVRGEASGHLPPTAFVSFLQNHDQIGNRAFGERIAQLTSPDALRAGLTILLLAPQVPLLFMGEEWGCRQPFPFFCDFRDTLADQVREGRRREFSRFPEFRDPKARERIPDPNALSTFQQAVLDWTTLKTPDGESWLEFYRGLLQVRQKEIVPLLPRIDGNAGRFQVHNEHGLCVEWDIAYGPRLCLYANLGPQPLNRAPQPQHGRIMAATSDDMAAHLASGRWPAWSVAWIQAIGPVST